MHGGKILLEQKKRKFPSKAALPVLNTMMENACQFKKITVLSKHK